MHTRAVLLQVSLRINSQNITAFLLRWYYFFVFSFFMVQNGFRNDAKGWMVLNYTLFGDEQKDISVMHAHTVEEEVRL